MTMNTRRMIAFLYYSLTLFVVLFSSIMVRNSFSGTPIDHIIVLFEENRTFDHYFGDYPGANGVTDNVSLPIYLGSNVTVSRFHLGNDSTPVPFSHNFLDAVDSYDNGKMDGFVWRTGNLTMGYYDNRDIPYYWNYASNYVLMDNFFTSCLGPSLPNHLYLIAGQSGKYKNNDKNATFDFPVIMDELDSNNISWRYYSDSVNYRTYGLWNPLPAFASFKNNTARLQNLQPNYQFLKDIKSGKLPAVSWVIPPGGKSEHPLLI